MSRQKKDLGTGAHDKLSVIISLFIGNGHCLYRKKNVKKKILQAKSNLMKQNCF